MSQKHKLKHGVITLLACFAALGMSACDDGGKSNMRPRVDRERTIDTNTKLRGYAAESTAALATLAYLELYRLTDIVFNRRDAKTLFVEGECQTLEIDTNAAASASSTLSNGGTPATLTVVTDGGACRRTNPGRNWDGSDVIRVTDFADGSVMAEMSNVNSSLQLILPGDRRTVTLTQNFKLEQNGAFTHFMRFDSVVPGANPTQHDIRIEHSGTIAFDTTKNEVSEIQTSMITVSVVVKKDGTEIVRSNLELKPVIRDNQGVLQPTDKVALQCGRPFGEWIANQSLQRRRGQVEQAEPYEVKTTATELMLPQSRGTKMALAACAPGFTMMQADILAIFRTLGRLGR